MASVADSVATFKSRLEALGIPVVFVRALVAQKIDTHGKFAWVVGLAPGSKEASDAFDAYVKAYRRFGIQQKNKVRPIDDYSESGVNQSFGAPEKLQLHDADVLAMVVRIIEGI
eukprot:2017993-Amphidinium_carterae.1